MGAIHIWADGGCEVNPGPCGIGVVVISENTREERSEFLGEGTNNIAELTAIWRGLQLVEKRGREAMWTQIYIYSDSAYAIGSLSQNWKAKKNIELIAKIRECLKHFPKVRFVKVKGHAGLAENERADTLATHSVTFK